MNVALKKYIKQIPLYNELMNIKSEYNEIVGQENLIKQEIKEKINFDSGTFPTTKRMNKLIKQLGYFLDDFEDKLYRNAACIASEEGTKYMETF